MSTSEIQTFTVETTAGPASNVVSGRLPDPIQTFTGGATGTNADAPPAAVAMPKLVFLDTETTSLRPDRRAWEIGLILRTPHGDVEHSWFVETEALDLGNADLMSLKIGKFYERHPQARLDLDREDAALDVEEEAVVLDYVEGITRGAHLIGAVVNFDTETLAGRMCANGLCPSWDHHLVDVESLAAGALRMPPPWKLDTFLAKFAITDDPADRHTALGDARRVRDLYDAVMNDTKGIK